MCIHILNTKSALINFKEVNGMRELIIDLIASCLKLETLNSFEVKNNTITIMLADGNTVTIVAK